MAGRGRSGFTLIELLIVVVIIGLLAAIAIPKFSATKENTLVGVMRSDLRNLATAQEAYFSEGNGYYAGVLPSASLLYSSSPGVTISIGTADATGWSASASVVNTARTCAVFVGSAPPIAPAVLEGQVACDPA